MNDSINELLWQPLKAMVATYFDSDSRLDRIELRVQPDDREPTCSVFVEVPSINDDARRRQAAMREGSVPILAKHRIVVRLVTSVGDYAWAELTPDEQRAAKAAGSLAKHDIDD